MKDVPYWRLSGFYFFYFAFVGAMAPFWGLYLKSLEFSAFQIGILMSLLQVMRIFAPNIWGLLVSSILYGAAFGIVRPMLQLMLLDLSPPNLRATLSSAGTFFLRLGQAISPLAAGLWLVFGGYDGMYLAFAVLALGFAAYAFFAQALSAGRAA